jgi:transcriptional regulator with XRE-family HTH domain
MGGGGEKMKITLKAARVNQGIGAAEAAKLLGITRNTLYTYEEGQVMPRADILQKMLEIYKIDIKKLKL